MLIICIEATESGQHYFESQSHRKECWMDGYVAVPPDLESEVVGCMGYGDLTVEDGKFVDFTPHPEWIPEPERQEQVSKPEPTEAEQLRADVDFIAAMTGVTL